MFYCNILYYIFTSYYILYATHFPLHILRRTVFSKNFTYYSLYSLHHTLYTIHCISIYGEYYMLYSENMSYGKYYILHTSHYALYTVTMI